MVTRLVIANPVPPCSSSVPDGRVVLSDDPWPTPQVSPGLSRDRCVANADINVRSDTVESNGPPVPSRAFSSSGARRHRPDHRARGHGDHRRPPVRSGHAPRRRHPHRARRRHVPRRVRQRDAGDELRPRVCLRHRRPVRRRLPGAGGAAPDHIRGQGARHRRLRSQLHRRGAREPDRGGRRRGAVRGGDLGPRRHERSDRRRVRGRRAGRREPPDVLRGGCPVGASDREAPGLRYDAWAGWTRSASTCSARTARARPSSPGRRTNPGGSTCCWRRTSAMRGWPRRSTHSGGD